MALEAGEEKTPEEEFEWEHEADGGEKQGKLYIRGDSKIFRFQNGKTESLFLQRKNPRRIAWTVLFRRQHKKGISEVISLPKSSPRAQDSTNKRESLPHYRTRSDNFSPNRK
jgi:ribosomal protein L24E